MLFVIAKNACNHRKKYSHTSPWRRRRRSQTQAQVEADGTVCAHAIVVGPVAAEVTAKLACLAAHEMLREYVRYPHIIMHVT